MKAAVWMLLATAGAWAQPQCTVSGVVTDESTGKPVAAVKVFLMHASPSSLPALLKSTSEQGAFCLEQVDSGDYLLQTQRSGYLNRTYGEGLILAVPATGALPPLEVKLLRRAVLSGMVVDGDGEPVANAQVSVYRRVETQNGDDQVDSQETDDRGTFRFDGLNPGTYFLGVKGRNSEQEFHVPFLDVGGQPRQEAFVENLSSTPIVLKAGKDVSGLLLTTRKMQFRHISGKAMGGPSYILLQGPNGNKTGIPVGPEGSFYREGLLPGRYMVESHLGNQVGRKEVDLTNGDADGVVVGLDERPVTPGNIPLQFRADGSGPQYHPSPGGFLFLQRSDGEGGSVAQLSPDGTLQFNHVVPGLYQLAGPWGEEDFYVKRILLGGHAVAGRTLDLRLANPGGIEVVMAAKSASVEGRVTHDGVLSQAVTVLLENALGKERTVTDQNGHFRIERAAPGKYRLFAIEGLAGRPWTPELAAALQEKSLGIELGDGDKKKQVEVPLISSQELAAAVK